MNTNHIKSLSIIISLKNNAQLLDSTLSSLSASSPETSRDIEVIIIDSNSCDNPISIIKPYSKLFDISFVSQYDNSIYEAWNKGLLIARGKCVTFLGAGDCLTPNSLKQLLKEISTLPSLCVLTSKSRIIYGNTVVISGKPFVYSEFIYRFTTNHSGLLYTSDIFDSYGNFDLSIGIAADYHFLLRIAPHVTFLHLDMVTCDYIHGGISSRSPKSLSSSFLARKRLSILPHPLNYLVLFNQYLIFYMRLLLGPNIFRKIT